MADRVDVYEDDAGEFRWVRWAGSDKVSNSGEGYKNEQWARHQARAKNQGDVVFNFPTDDESDDR